MFTGDLLAQGISLYAGKSPDAFGVNGGHACALNVTSEYMVITVQCIMPVSGKFLTIYQPEGDTESGIEVCDVQVYGEGKLTCFSNSLSLCAI